MFIIWLVNRGELNILFRVHLIPLILYTEESPLETTEDLKSGYCKHCEIIVSEMGRKLVCPRAPEDEVGSNYPKVDLQVPNGQRTTPSILYDKKFISEMPT